MSRLFVKDFFRTFKRDNLIVLVDVGILRSHNELSLGMDFIPHLIGQAEYEKLTKQRSNQDFDEIIELTSRKAAGKHK
jgi:hypothetical protein